MKLKFGQVIIMEFIIRILRINAFYYRSCIVYLFVMVGLSFPMIMNIAST